MHHYMPLLDNVHLLVDGRYTVVTAADVHVLLYARTQPWPHVFGGTGLSARTVSGSGGRATATGVTGISKTPGYFSPSSVFSLILFFILPPRQLQLIMLRRRRHFRPAVQQHLRPL